MKTQSGFLAGAFLLLAVLVAALGFCGDAEAQAHAMYAVPVQPGLSIAGGTVRGPVTINNTLSVQQTTPTATNTYQLGTSSLRWSSINGVLGNFSGLLTLSTATASGTISSTVASGAGYAFKLSTGATDLGLSIAATDEYEFSANGYYNGSTWVHTDTTKPIWSIDNYVAASGDSWTLLRVAIGTGASSSALAFNSSLGASFGGSITSVGNSAPSANNTYTSGTSSNRWSNVFSVLGNYSGLLTLSTATASGNIASTVASGSDAINLTQGARLHWSGAGSDYASSDGTTVTFAGPVTVQALAATTGAFSGKISSTVASGSDAIGLTSGARLHFSGAGSDYCSSDGTTITCAGPVTTQAFNATTITGSSTVQGTALQISSTAKAPVYLSSTQQAIQSGRQALSAGSATVTFGTAFSATPACTCSDESANAATIRCTPATGTLTLAQTASSDTIGWICVGNK